MSEKKVSEEAAQAAHTPGPWVVVVADDDTGELEVRPANLADSRSWAGYQTIAAVGRDDVPGNVADARLIAAAPDLLAALKDLLAALKRVKRTLPFLDPAWAFHYEQARAAIAKAEGEAPDA